VLLYLGVAGCQSALSFTQKLSRRLLLTVIGLALAVICFSLGSWWSQRAVAEQLANNNARVSALHDEMALSILQMRRAQMPRATATNGLEADGESSANSRSELVEEIKRELQSEMGLLPVRLLRERRDSFVELYAYDSVGAAHYSTAGYLGDGYFITVKHGVIAIGDEGSTRRITAIKIRYKGKDVPAHVVDSGNANDEVHPGDWAIIKVRGAVDLPRLRIDTEYAYQFADPIFRLGNDYSKGIILSTGYVGERTANGLVTCLTDGHPGVSGGGVLDQKGNLVGIPVGRMAGDYRFSFILPIRSEMFRKIPTVGDVAAR
jgi:Trypsin-like peptidase domain